MSNAAAVKFEIDGPLGVLTLQHAPHNLLGPDLIDGITDALLEAEKDGVKAVLIKSDLKHFSAGADLSMFKEIMKGGDSLARSPEAFLETMTSFPLPIVAAVHGVCVGGGFELALTCDYIIAAKSAVIGSVEATLGINPLMGAVQRQVEAAGGLRAKEMSMLGRRYSAETLERWNMINEVVDDEKLQEAAHAVAMELANGPTLAHKATKKLARIAADEGVTAADKVMEEMQKVFWTSQDLKIGVDSLMKNGPGKAKFIGK